MRNLFKIKGVLDILAILLVLMTAYLLSVWFENVSLKTQVEHFWQQHMIKQEVCNLLLQEGNKTLTTLIQANDNRIPTDNNIHLIGNLDDDYWQQNQSTSTRAISDYFDTYDGGYLITEDGIQEVLNTNFLITEGAEWSKLDNNTIRYVAQFFQIENVSLQDWLAGDQHGLTHVQHKTIEAMLIKSNVNSGLLYFSNNPRDRELKRYSILARCYSKNTPNEYLQMNSSTSILFGDIINLFQVQNIVYVLE